MSDETARDRIRRLAAAAPAAPGRGDPRLADRRHGPQRVLENALRRLAGGAPGADRPAAEWLQWLPPDHFQEEPRGDVARRTSPTNIGLLQLATLSAHDLGHAGLMAVVLRLRNTFETLERMERHRGHFYNWYDTRDLAPLLPRYVSTVDSGNLAGYVVLAARSRNDVLALADRYRSLPELEWTFDLARHHGEAEVAALGLGPQDLPEAATLLSLLLCPHEALRAPAAVLARNGLGQRSLWKHGISGDLPIVLVRIASTEEAAIVPAVLRAHRFWRGRGVSVDVVILNERAEGYVAETDDHVDRAIAQAGADAWRDRPGGVFVVHSAHITEADSVLLLSAARVVLDGSRGSIGQQPARLGVEQASLPQLAPSLPESPVPEALPRPDSLLFDHGLGGFSADGREYVIHLEPGETTPAPWVNVVANRRLGFVVSESGGGYKWAENSGENRLTPWRNDPVADEPGEALYLRDEETGAVWSPTPQPAPAEGAYQIRYGAGYATFRHRSHGLEQALRLWVRQGELDELDRTPAWLEPGLGSGSPLARTLRHRREGRPAHDNRDHRPRRQSTAAGPHHEADEGGARTPDGGPGVDAGRVLR